MKQTAGKGGAEKLLETAAQSIKRDEFAQAQAMCEKVLADTPDNADALEMLGRIAMLQYRWQEAIGFFDRALRVRVDPWTLANLGNCYWKTGDLDQAEYCLRGALELEPGFTIARIGVATVLHARGRFEDSLRELASASRRDPADTQIDTRRGCTLVRLEKFDEAQAAFEKASSGAGRFIYPRLVAFDRAAWEAFSLTQHVLRPPQTAMATDELPGTGGHVTLISCDPPYVRKFGMPFLRSYAEQSLDDGILHLHVYDPDDTIIGELRAVVSQCGLKNFVASTEHSPFPADRPSQRRAYYACGRLAHMGYWLKHYARPVLSLDVDFIVEGSLAGIVEMAHGADIGLNPRVPIDSPWLDIIANIIVANPTPAAIAYFSAVRNYALAMLEREPDSWLVDQTAMYCVLAMMRRFAREPRVAWLPPDAADGRLWHIGHAYEHLLQDHRYRKYADGAV